MRTSRIIAILSSLALVPAGARAQGTAPAVTTGSADLGFRGTTVDGDDARYNRYRDLGNGLFLQTFQIERQKGAWQYDVDGSNVGRRDQRYRGSVTRFGKLEVRGSWDQVPMLMSRTTRSLFQQDLGTTPRVLTIDDSIQTAAQASAAALPGLFDTNAKAFDLRSHRHVGRLDVDYLPGTDLTIRARARLTEREGEIPYGMSFGHSSLVEYPAPIKHRLTDVDGTAEYAHDIWLFRGGFTGSWFHNTNTFTTVDNPFRAVDSASTPSRGQQSLPPSNSFVGVNGTASVRLPGHSRVTAYLSTGFLKDAGDPLIPQSVNTAFTTAPLPRLTVDGKAHTTALNLTFLSRPTRYADIDVRFRSYHYDNQTPEFLMTQRVSYDNTPASATYSSLGGVTSPVGIETEPFGVKRETLDADLRIRPASIAGVSVGYSRIAEDRTHRIIEATTEHVLRTTFDAFSSRWFSLRTKYEHGSKRGTATDEAMRELFAIGEQPLIRQWDVASRDRNRVTLLGQLTLTSTLAVNASVAAGKDDYVQSVFGLRDNTHRIYAAGIDVVPSETVTLTASYSFERYTALSRSRQANPPSGSAVFDYDTFLALSKQSGGFTSNQQVADASRNWATDGTDRVHSFVLTAAINKIRDKLDLAFSYDFNRSRGLYAYTTGPVEDRTLPEEVVVTTSLPAPTQLPPTFSELQRGTMDALYSINRRFAVGLTYWYERYRVNDFTLDEQSVPTGLVRGSALLLGYLYMPYTANTVFGRLVVRW